METETKKVKTEPKDIFIYLFGIIMLYASATSFLTLIFQYTNFLVPDKLESGQYAIFARLSIMKIALAWMIIVFPLYIYVMWHLNKTYKKEPEKMRMALRKWLIYFTLFITALIIVGDLVMLILRFLNGELTLKFIIKIISVLAVAASIFGYYLWDIKREGVKGFGKMKIFIYAVIAIVLVTIISGFFIVGSPKNERLRLFDEKRVGDLQFLQGQIVQYWIKKQVLPENLVALEDSIAGVVIPQDPETGTNYYYEIKGPEEFELCATFAKSSSPNSITQPKPIIPESYIGQNWEHNAGYVCFERKIDKELYKENK